MLRVTFRARLLSIAGVAAVAFLLLIGAGMLIADRVERQLAAIQNRYLPKAELEPDLQAQLERLQHGFQDAVSAHDVDALKAKATMKAAFLDSLAARRDALDPDEVAALETAFLDFYAAAYDVSERLLASEAGEGLGHAIATMQTKRARVKELITTVAALDRHELTQAFAAAVDAETTARSTRLVISIACLVAVLLLSLALSRSLLRSLAELSAAFRRFGEGDFRPIPVTTKDELATLAVQANQMAANLERIDRERSKAEHALKVANSELEAFSYSVAHDLRAPLRGINGFSRALIEDAADRLDDESKGYLDRIAAGAERMGQLIDALLALSRVTRSAFERHPVNMTQLAETVAAQLRAAEPTRVVDFVAERGVIADGDPALLRALLDNLLGNAWKFTSTREHAHVTFGTAKKDGAVTYFVCDDGAGFDMAYVQKLFAPFQRLHSGEQFKGTGIGLATVQRIVHRHGGHIRAEGAVGKGARFEFTLSP